VAPLTVPLGNLLTTYVCVAAQTYSNPQCDGAPTAEGNGPGQLGSLGRCSSGGDLFMFDDPSKFVVGSCVDGDVLVAVHDDPQCADPIQKYEYLSESCQAFCSLATPPDPPRGTSPIARRHCRSHLTPGYIGCIPALPCRSRLPFSPSV
jgi:hypothetical protein